MALVVMILNSHTRTQKKLPDAKGRAVSVFSRVLRSLSLRNENRVDDVGFNFTGTL